MNDDPRMEAAARAIFQAWYDASHPAMRTERRGVEWSEQAAILASAALAAADAADPVRAELVRVRELLTDLTEASFALIAAPLDYEGSGWLDIEGHARAARSYLSSLTEPRAEKP